MAYGMDIILPVSLKKKEMAMRQPPPDVYTLCKDSRHDLSPETVPLARELKAVSRARKVKTPVHLLRLVLRYSGLDTSRLGDIYPHRVDRHAWGGLPDLEGERRIPRQRWPHV
jgi:hypothetical protein